MQRLISIILEVKTAPRQPAPTLREKLGISKSQYYKDKALLKDLGFEFEYSRSRKRHEIIRDMVLQGSSLSLTERLALIMAFRQLSASGDHILTYEGFNAARKLAAELPQPLRESLFDDIVLKEGFGCEREIMEKLQTAVCEKRRVILAYKSAEQIEPVRHDLEPYHIFFRRRALYVEGYSWTEKGIRIYRMNRIKSVEFTNMLFTIRDDYDFGKRHKNAFSAFPGETTEHVKVRFERGVSPFIEESLWHHSQVTTREQGGSLIFEVDVAEPREVMWWSFFWGAGAKILEPGWLLEEAKAEIAKMSKKYK